MRDALALVASGYCRKYKSVSKQLSDAGLHILVRDEVEQLLDLVWEHGSRITFICCQINGENDLDEVKTAAENWPDLQIVATTNAEPTVYSHIILLPDAATETDVAGAIDRALATLRRLGRLDG